MVDVVVTSLTDRIAEVEERIAALVEGGRRREEITLIAVTKVYPASAILDAYQAGLREFGENYVQEFETKRPELGDLHGARFHLIGHLQSNKARRAAELVPMRSDGGHAEAGKAPGRALAKPRCHDRSQAVRRRKPNRERLPEELPALVEAVHAVTIFISLA